jgi:hypothetical protein
VPDGLLPRRSWFNLSGFLAHWRTVPLPFSTLLARCAAQPWPFCPKEDEP